jgi:hypothetical protein
MRMLTLNARAVTTAETVASETETVQQYSEDRGDGAIATKTNPARWSALPEILSLEHVCIFCVHTMIVVILLAVSIVVRATDAAFPPPFSVSDHHHR